MKHELIGTDGKRYILADKPPKKRTRHFLWLLLTGVSVVGAPPITPFILILWVLVSFETSRTNRKNGY